MTASTANSQALKFRICSTDEENERVFGTLKWAGALPDWDGPVKGERPSAYLILLCDLALGKNKLQDDGITAQTIMLGAVEMGYGGCMLGNVERKRLAELLDIDTAKYSIDLVLALGKPKEKVVVVPLGRTETCAITGTRSRSIMCRKEVLMRLSCETFQLSHCLARISPRFCKQLMMFHCLIGLRQNLFLVNGQKLPVFHDQFPVDDGMLYVGSRGALDHGIDETSGRRQMGLV